MSDRTERFQRKPSEPQEKKDEKAREPEEVLRFSPEEEAVRSQPCCRDNSLTAFYSPSWRSPTARNQLQTYYSASPPLKMP